MRERGKLGEALPRPISDHYAHAQRGIIMQLVKCCGVLEAGISQVWHGSKRLAGERGAVRTGYA